MALMLMQRHADHGTGFTVYWRWRWVAVVRGVFVVNLVVLGVVHGIVQLSFFFAMYCSWRARVIRRFQTLTFVSNRRGGIDEAAISATIDTSAVGLGFFCFFQPFLPFFLPCVLHRPGKIVRVSW